MSFLQLTPNPSRKPDQRDDAGADGPARQSSTGAPPPPVPGDLKPLQSAPIETSGIQGLGGIQPVKLRSSRFGELEEHELIHLIDALDDERSRARFRESIYISVIIWIAICWFLFYGPRILFHQPVLRDPIAVLKEHDRQQQLTYLNQPPPRPRPAPVMNQKVIQQIQKQMQAAPRPQPVPQPTVQQPPPPQPEQAHNTAPPVPQPAMPLPSAPKPTPSSDLPSAPRPTLTPNAQSAHNALQSAMRGALSGRSGADSGGPSAAGPLQAGAQILSDIGDWDPSLYMRRLHNDIQRNWDPLIPEEVQPPLMKRGIVGIRFIILRDGQIGDMKLETTSGDVALDKAAWYAITSEGQFPQLPKEFHGQQLELRIGFYYNTPVHQ
ncbi:MAG TPA: TonB C-terminal domain-containing protein [Acidobacteriaceae bacterium]|nr:TonB C-terminal domain-containing protein [Acidobacteriaceae bacterium]